MDTEIAGSGCPQGTASVAVIDNTLSVLFDAYGAQTSPGHQIEHKACNYAVVLRIPAGHSIALTRTECIGYVSIPLGGMGRFRLEYFFAGETGTCNVTFQPGSPGNWIVAVTNGDAWSPCGGEMILRGDSSVLARKALPNSPSEAEVQVESIIHYFNWRYCDGG